MRPQRNKAGKLIVLYDEDGFSKLGMEAAAAFVQKQWDNVRLLSGGRAHA